jgi:hypothetical protein
VDKLLSHAGTPEFAAEKAAFDDFFGRGLSDYVVAKRGAK